MNVSLTPDLEKFIGEQVDAGLYPTSSDLVNEALRQFFEGDGDRFAHLREDVMSGFAEIEDGNFFEFDESTTPALLADVKARGRARLAELPKNREENETLPPRV